MFSLSCGALLEHEPRDRARIEQKLPDFSQKISYLLNKPGKSVALTGRIEEIRPVLGQCNALRPKILSKHKKSVKIRFYQR